MIQIVPYEKSHESGLRELCQIPVSGNISLALERETHYIDGAKVQCEEEKVFVAFDEKSNKVLAAFNMGKRRLWYNNKVENVRYLCDLRIHPDKQNSSLLFSLTKKMKEISQNDTLPAQTVVFADNHKMNDFIKRIADVRVSPAIPRYHFAGNLITYLIPVISKNKLASNWQVRKAVSSDTTAMQNLMNQEGPKINFFPYYDFSELNRDYYKGLRIEDYFLLFEGEELAGMAAIWDQSDFKQTRIKGYSKLYSIIRPLYNLVNRLLFRPTLPAKGKLLHYSYLHSLLIKNRKPEYFEKLLRYIQTEIPENKFDYLLCSLDPNDPLSQVPEKLGYVRKIKGNYFLVNQGQAIPRELKQDYFYIEGARI